MALDPGMRDALNTHMGREFGAHFQYLEMNAWLEDQGLPELADFFGRQAAEEHVHAMKFFRHIVDMGGPAVIPAMDAPVAAFEDVESLVGMALAQEQQVTRWIGELVTKAREVNDHATEVFLQWFVTEQIEEEATMGELLQVVRHGGPGGLLLVEDHVARRLSGGAGPAAGGAA